MTEKTIRVLIAENHPLLRRGLRGVLQDEADLVVAAEAGNGDEVLRLADEVSPQVALVSSQLRGQSYLDVVEQLTDREPPVPTLVLGACRSQHVLRAALSAGAWGYLLTEETPERIVEAVRGAASGQQGWLSPSVAACLMEAWCDPLTRKELEVVRLLAAGNTAPDVAAQLGISVRTARNHLNNIYGKLDLHSQPELVAWAWRSGVMTPGAQGLNARGNGEYPG